MLAPKSPSTGSKKTTSQRLGIVGTSHVHGGAAGEPPPGSEKPDRRFLQAQHRFCLRRASFSVQESGAPQLQLSFGRFSEHLRVLAGFDDRQQGGSGYPPRTVAV